MNQKFALPAIAMFAVIMGIGMVAPAMAAPNDRANNDNPRANAGKIYICHVELNDPDTPEDDTVDLIRVSANSAHNNPAKHPADFTPFELDDGTLTCEEPVEPDPDPEPPIEA